jgi:hypothetical protein
MAGFYDALLDVLDDAVVHDGAWRLLDPRQAWDGNPSHEHLIAFTWTTSGGKLASVAVVNLADTWSQGYLPLSDAELSGRTVTLVDRLGEDRFERNGDDLTRSGLYIDAEPWAHHVFAVERW